MRLIRPIYRWNHSVFRPLTILQFFLLFSSHTKYGEGNVFIGVYHYVQRGVCIPRMSWDSIPPQKADPSAQKVDPLRNQTPRMLQDTVNKWAVRILLECILVFNKNSYITFPVDPTSHQRQRSLLMLRFNITKCVKHLSSLRCNILIMPHSGTQISRVIAGSFRVSLFIALGCLENLGIGPWHFYDK